MQVASVTSGWLRYEYTYDSMGNIATYAAPGKGTVTYTYDNQGQLLKAAGDTTYTYTYDGAGNILTASDGTVTHSYTYGDTDWKDLLTGFDGQAIIYDAIGNPTSYCNGTRWAMTWENGRSLATASDGTNSLSFAYDASGLRTSKTVNGTTYRYYYAGGKLMRMSWGANILDFFYDESGLPYAMKYNGTAYYYITNLQGDVMRIVDGSQNTVTSYDYDPYGKVISATGTLANINPLRYRGYVYDTETGFYYLQSRYYDPTIGRFINADSYATTGQGIIGNDMFVYCLNSSVNCLDRHGTDAVVLYDKDSLGHIGILAQDLDGNWWHYYWGSRGTWNRVMCAIGISIEAYSWCVSYSGETISLDDINESNAYAGEYEEMFYFVGDFSSAVDSMKTYSDKYNLYTNNCSQVSLGILADANSDYRELFTAAADYTLPKNAKKYISENIDNFMQTGMCYYKAALQIYNMLF